MDIYLFNSVILWAAIWAVLCRMKKLHHQNTRPIVFLQYFFLGLGLFGATVLPIEWRSISAGTGVFLLLALGSWRWKHGAPQELTRPDALHPVTFHRIKGGSK